MKLLSVYFGVLTLCNVVWSETGYSRRFHYRDDGFRNISTNSISLSGFSSGGAFAQMLQFSYPDLFSGVGVFSHNYYRCGPPNGNDVDYDTVCTILTGSPPDRWYDPLLVHRDIADYFSRGLIGDPRLLRNKKLYVYVGLRSSIFAPQMSLNILRVYERYIQNPEAIRTRVQDSPFVMPTNNNYGPSCTAAGIFANTSFIGNCGFSGAFEALNFISENVRRQPRDNQPVSLGRLVEFDQRQFYGNISLAMHQMDSVGYYYIPRRCSNRNNFCSIHFYFHGCRAGREFAGTTHITNSGFLEVAELNNIIMVFPQTLSTPNGSRSGCWDTFGVSGPLYATREGIQVRIVKAMIDRVLAQNSLD